MLAHPDPRTPSDAAKRLRAWSAMPSAVARGTLALARARITLAHVAGGEILRFNEDASRRGRPSAGALDDDSRMVAKVAFWIPRVARRLPWRADCLVQAIAGQRWLLANGIATNIVIGAENSAEIGFGAHAWLMRGETVVLGGDIAKYVALIGLQDETKEGRCD